MNAKEVWEDFIKSHKQHFFITGGLGSGKSTFAKEIQDAKHIPCIKSEAIYEDALHPAYIRLHSLKEETIIIGCYDENAKTMVPNTMAFENEGLRFLKECKSVWIAIDEIGYLEKDAINYQGYLEKILDDQTHHVLAVLRKDKKYPFMEHLLQRKDVYLYDMDEHAYSINCILMASGSSSRFGSNKLLAPFLGEPLITHVLRQIPYEMFQHVYCVTRYKEVAKLAKEFPLQVILHELPYEKDTMRLGIEADENVASCMFVTCDQPLRKSTSIRNMILCAQSYPKQILRLGYGNAMGNPAIFPATYFEELKHLHQGEKGSSIIKRHSKRVQKVEAHSELELFDIDTKEDLKILENRMHLERSLDVTNWREISCHKR